MIGTSEGEQYTSSFEHTIASTMPPGGPEKPAGALKQQGSYQGSEADLLSPVADRFGRRGNDLSHPYWEQEFGVNPDRPTELLDHVLPQMGYKDEPTMEQRLRNAGKRVTDNEAAMKSGRVIDPDDLRIDKENDMMDIDPNMQKDQRRQFGMPSKQNISLPQPLISVLSHPDIANAIANPKIDRDHEVPYVAGASSKPNDYTTHVDKSVPSSVTLSGQTFDPAIPLNIHEQVERHVMEQLKANGMTDEKAYEIAHHEFAEVAEDAWYKANGIKVEDANKWWAKIDKKTEQDKGNFPKDLYKAPYPHDKVEGVKHEPSGVSAEWAMGKLAANVETPYEKNSEGHGIQHPHPPPITPLKSGTNPNILRLPTGGGKPPSERIVAPAVRSNQGEIFTGNENHTEAFQAAIAAGKSRGDLDTKTFGGFVTNTGRYIDRKEAFSLAKENGQMINGSESRGPLDQMLMSHQIDWDMDKRHEKLFEKFKLK